MKLAAVGVLACMAPSLGNDLEAGTWSARLETAGGPLRFQLILSRADSKWRAEIQNADERIAVPTVELSDNELLLRFDHYDAQIRATVSETGAALDGEWTKRAGPDRIARLPFHALLIGGCTMPGPSGSAGFDRFGPGRWSVRFQAEPDPAVLVVRAIEGGVAATILTTTGDYRYLSVSESAPEPRGPISLACFDGAHAFLLRARWTDDGGLEGDFWSGDRWHDTWTARKDAQARLPDPFDLTHVNATARLGDLAFPDATGTPRSLDGPGLAGRARLIVLMGTWCPNCNDEARLLAELDRRYRERGLAIVGIAFELTGEFQRDAQQVERLRQRHGLEFPILIAGTSDKQQASKAFPLIDRVRAFPTTLFVRKDGSVRAVHQGYSGPATGAEHDKLREDFERLIAELLE